MSCPPESRKRGGLTRTLASKAFTESHLTRPSPILHVGKRSVRVETFGPDIYRRLLAVVWVGETNVNVEMVRAGLAEVYRGARCQAS